MKNYLIGLVLISMLGACNSEPKTSETLESSMQEVKPNVIDEIVTDLAPTDTINVAKFEFEEDLFDFGEIKEGEIVKHTFAFTNVGKQALTITNARSTCGCTVPQWPKEAIAPGESGSIEVSFNSRGKKNQQNKPVTITANTYPAQTVVYIKGKVVPEVKPSTD